ncbi:MAG: HAD family hydrolase [Pirellulaceae bacterium]|jgi:phosphoglycolate phosphatase|nr:HAD family hydrolase [Pirellulaceae bacterium]
MGLKLVIFDFDYTLADSTRGAVECINFGLRACGYAERDERAIRRVVGYSLEETVRRLAGEQANGRTDEFRRAFVQRADQVMVQFTELFPTVGAVCSCLDEAGLPRAIVSTKHAYRIEAILARHGLAEQFSPIVGGGDVERHKPHPDGLLTVIRRTKLDRQDVLYVGDHVVDAEAAQRAGIPFVGVLSGATTEEEFSAYPLQTVLDDISGLPEFLVSNGSL